MTSNSVTISNPVCSGGCNLTGDTCPNNLVDILSGNTITVCDSCKPDGVKEQNFEIEHLYMIIFYPKIEFYHI